MDVKNDDEFPIACLCAWKLMMSISKYAIEKLKMDNRDFPFVMEFGIFMLDAPPFTDFKSNFLARYQDEIRLANEWASDVGFNKAVEYFKGIIETLSSLIM